MKFGKNIYWRYHYNQLIFFFQNKTVGRRHSYFNLLTALGKCLWCLFPKRPSCSTSKLLWPLLPPPGGVLWRLSSVLGTGRNPRRPDRDCRRSGAALWCFSRPVSRSLRNMFIALFIAMVNALSSTKNESEKKYIDIVNLKKKYSLSADFIDTLAGTHTQSSIYHCAKTR